MGKSIAKMKVNDIYHTPSCSECCRLPEQTVRGDKQLHRAPLEPDPVSLYSVGSARFIYFIYLFICFH